MFATQTYAMLVFHTLPLTFLSSCICSFFFFINGLMLLQQTTLVIGI